MRWRVMIRSSCFFSDSFRSPNESESPPSSRFIRVIAPSTISRLAASGCSLPNTTQIDYKSTGKSKISALEMPPDIVNAPENPAEVSSRVLTPVSGMHIERADHARWLVVEHKTPEQLWPQLRAFWQAQGFRLLADA